jgi:PIN domain nuclease of toxin-antitoxin system
MAMIQREEGAEMVISCLPWAIISAVNLAEAVTKLILTGMDEQLAWWHIAVIGCETAPFDEEQARTAGGLVKITKPFGLSLGDRACLALAIQRKATVYTTDRIWKKLDLGIRIEAIR